MSKKIPTRHQIGDMVHFALNDDVEVKHRILCEVLSITFHYAAVTYDLAIEGHPEDAVLLQVHSSLVFPLPPVPTH